MALMRTTQLRLAATLAAAVLGCGGADETPAALEAERAEQLASLGYLDWAEGADPSRSGVTFRAPAADDGALLLYASRPRSRAELIDRAGRVLHRWSAAPGTPAWQHVELGPGGDLYAIDKGGALLRLDGSSREIFRAEIGAHHDLAFAPDGALWVIAGRVREVPHGRGTLPIVDDRLVRLSPDGKLEREISLWDALGDRVAGGRLDEVAERIAQGLDDRERPGSLADVFHANSIQLVAWPGAPEGAAALLSVRELGRLVVLRLDTAEPLWEWGAGVLDAQHDATLEPDGRLLVFDNGTQRGWSRILDVDPRRGRSVTRYAAPGFFSARRGSVEATPGGGLLVTESDEGRVFEVDADGALVWEFWNPDVKESSDGTRSRAAIYRMTRVEPAALPPEAQASAAR